MLDPLGLAQHGDFWDTLAHNVDMYRSDVSSMKTHSTVLDIESEIAVNVLLCGTGWKSAYPLFFKEQSFSLGLPPLP